VKGKKKGVNTYLGALRLTILLKKKPIREEGKGGPAEPFIPSLHKGNLTEEELFSLHKRKTI